MFIRVPQLAIVLAAWCISSGAIAQSNDALHFKKGYWQKFDKIRVVPNPTALDREAMKQAEQFVRQQAMIRCDGADYAVLLGRLKEVKTPDIKVWVDFVSDVDRLNGIQWKGAISLDAYASRSYSATKREWLAWSGSLVGSISVDVLLSMTNKTWTFTPSNISGLKAPISCANVDSILKPAPNETRSASEVFAQEIELRVINDFRRSTIPKLKPPVECQADVTVENGYVQPSDMNPCNSIPASSVFTNALLRPYDEDYDPEVVGRNHRIHIRWDGD